MFPFRPPGPAKRATSPPTPGRVDGFASHPTMKRASGAGKERRYLDGYSTRQKKNQRQRHQVPAGPLQNIGPTAEVIGPGGSRASSFVPSRARTCSSGALSKVLRSIRQATSGAGACRHGFLRDRWCCETDRRPGDCPAGRLVGDHPYPVVGLSAGPDAMEAGVVFAGCTIPPNGLPILHPYPVTGP